MKPKRHTPAQIIRKLRTAEQLLHQRQLVGDVCRNPEVFAPAYHRRQPDQCPSTCGCSFWRKNVSGLTL